MLPLIRSEKTQQGKFTYSILGKAFKSKQKQLKIKQKDQQK